VIDPEFIALVNLHKARYPSSTESLDRTPLHNANIGGAQHSYHLDVSPRGAKAIDLIFDLIEDLLPAALYARTLGFGGIEVDFSNNHLHLDMRPLTKFWHVVYSHDHEYTLEEYLTLQTVSV